MQTNIRLKTSLMIKKISSWISTNPKLINISKDDIKIVDGAEPHIDIGRLIKQGAFQYRVYIFHYPLNQYTPKQFNTILIDLNKTIPETITVDQNNGFSRLMLVQK